MIMIKGSTQIADNMVSTTYAILLKTIVYLDFLIFILLLYTAVLYGTALQENRLKVYTLAAFLSLFPATLTS
jgi:hypothetical protein